MATILSGTYVGGQGLVEVGVALRFPVCDRAESAPIEGDLGGCDNHTKPMYRYSNCDDGV